MTVKSADKKPEKYVGPEGKPKIRMVSVDKEVVKSEAYKEPQGQAKRMMSPLQKARMDKEKRDRDLDGNLKKLKNMRKTDKSWGKSDAFDYHEKSEGKTFKDFREAVSKLPGGNKHLATAGTKATIMHPVTRVSKKVDKKDLKKHVDAGWKHMGPKRNRVEDTDEGYASDAQRKAVWASKNEKGKNESVNQVDEISRSMTPMRNKFGGTVIPKKFDAYKKHMKTHKLDEPTVRMIHQNPDEPESKRMMKNPKYAKAMDLYKAAHKNESVDEVLDTPKAMQSYKNKAKASYDKATSSAAAKILRGKDKDGNRADHRPELKTMDKRKKGMAAADMVAVKRTFDALRGNK